MRNALLARGRRLSAGSCRGNGNTWLPLAKEGFDLAEVSFPEVNGSGCVSVLTNGIPRHCGQGTNRR